MSIIAQARSLLLTHRGIKLDVRDGCSYLLRKGLKTIPVTNHEEFIPHSYNPRPQIPQAQICMLNSDHNTPVAYHHNINKPLKMLVKNATYLREHYVSPFNCQNRLNSSRRLKISLRISSNHYHKSRRESKRSMEPSTFGLTLGILGLFGGMTASDVEEETSKLTDEQKISKMSPAELSIAKGVLAMCNQEYGKANDLFHEALHLAQDSANLEQETLVLNLLAANYFEKGDYGHAEELFIDLIKRMIASDVDPTDPAILELSLKLASIYSRKHETHEKALKGFKFVIDSLLNSLHDLFSNIDDLDVDTLSEERRNELALLGWSYDWFAKHLITANDYTGAADMLQQALRISTKVLGPLHDQTLILLNDVGTTLAMNNAAEQGKTYLRRAVEGAIESKSEELASFYVNLGLVNLKLNKFNEARRYCEYSIELALKNAEHPNSREVLKLSKNCLSEIDRLVEVVRDK